MRKAVLFKVKDKDTWVKWCEELATTLHEESLETLNEEKVRQEMTMIFTVNKVDYVLGYVDGEMLPANMNREINQKHKAMKEQCLELIVDADVNILYNLKTKDSDF